MTLILVICFSLRGIYIFIVIYVLYLDCLLRWKLRRVWNLIKGNGPTHSIIQSLRRELRFSVENWTEIDKTQL